MTTSPINPELVQQYKQCEANTNQLQAVRSEALNTIKKHAEEVAKTAAKQKEGLSNKAKLFIAAALGAAAMYLVQSKKSKKAAEDTSVSEAIAAQMDKACVRNDFKCLCDADRSRRPVECDSGCPMQNNLPDRACLEKKYGANYDQKGLELDKSGQLVTRATPATPASGEATMGGAPANPLALSRGSSNIPNSGEIVSSSEVAGSSTSGLNSAYLNSQSPASPSAMAIYAKADSSELGRYMPGGERDPASQQRADAAQIAAPTSNMFNNVTRVYRKYQADLLP